MVMARARRWVQEVMLADAGHELASRKSKWTGRVMGARRCKKDLRLVWRRREHLLMTAHIPHYYPAILFSPLAAVPCTRLPSETCLGLSVTDAPLVADDALPVEP